MRIPKLRDSLNYIKPDMCQMVLYRFPLWANGYGPIPARLQSNKSIYIALWDSQMHWR